MKNLLRGIAFLFLIVTIIIVLNGEFFNPPDQSGGAEKTAELILDTFARIPTLTVTPPPLPEPFSFASMGDAQGMVTNFNATVDQIEDLHPDLVLFNGDLEEDGITTDQMDSMVGVLRKNGILDRTFLVRGNHDDHTNGSALRWENYFENLAETRPFPTGMTHYTSLDPDTYYLTYSFIYGNSIFIGLDNPGNAKSLTRPELDFVDERLAYAEATGLTHAFLFFHGPFYCVEQMHCTCTERTDSGCTPTTLISILSKHPIVSATFHGHEHILGWTHMDSTRLANLSVSFEQFITSPSGGWTYNEYLYPKRIDYYAPNMETEQGFALIYVDGKAFTIDLFKTGSAMPVWSKKFSK